MIHSLHMWHSNITAKLLTKILQKYTGITPTFVKDSKGFSEYLRLVHLGKDEELVSFNVSALFTSIPVPTALEVINQLFTEHIGVPEARGKFNCTFKENTVGLKKDEVMKLLICPGVLCLLSRVTSSKSYTVLLWVPHAPQWWPTSIWTTQGSGSLGPELPIPIKEWKRYVDDVFSIIPKGK